MSQLQIIQNKFIRIILRVDPREFTDLIHNECKLMKLCSRRDLHFALLVFKCMKGLALEYLSEKILLIPDDRGRITRALTRGDLQVPHTLLVRTTNAFTVKAAHTWNAFSPEMRGCTSVDEFKLPYIERNGFL